ncbi:MULTISPECIES: sel1 repeat family protein [Rhodomicrobium]|uniref:sel1 repeat family protein n=1 Tax=Rhodomicrobium TaxID=1068 RepID=UPI000F748AC2|nr:MULTISPECIES: sel1 repeat family protein [Rhodomicrobium]
MADDDQNGRQPELPFGAGSMPQRLSERVARVNSSDMGMPVETADTLPLHKMHDGRVVRPAGRMIVGSRAPAPLGAPLDPANALMEHQQLFSSAREGKPRLSGGATVAVVCAVAVGATAALTAIVNHGGGHGGSADADQRHAAQYQGADVSHAALAQAAQAGTTPVAAITPSGMERQVSADEPNLVRIASQEAPGLAIDNISGISGAPIPVRIVITLGDSEEYSFLMFRGLPDNLSLSAGFRLKDSWAVSLRDVQKLALVSPPGYEGAFKLEVLLVKGRNTPVESRLVNVRLSEGAGIPAPQAEETVASIPRDPVPTSRILTSAPPEAEPRLPRQVEPERLQQPSLARPAPAAPSPGSTATKLQISPDAEATMLERGARLLSTGDVSSARLLFEHIAKKGSGRAALALAQTFDPAYLRSMNTLGLKADPEKAREWYTVAAQLGQREAKERLSALAGR